MNKNVCHTWATSRENQQDDLCTQQKLRSAWADQSLPCPHEEALGPSLPIEHTAKTLIRFGGCQALSSLGAQVILLVLSCGGSYHNFSRFFLLIKIISLIMSQFSPAGRAKAEDLWAGFPQKIRNKIQWFFHDRSLNFYDHSIYGILPTFCHIMLYKRQK